MAEVFRLGTEKQDENLAFRRYLSAHHASASAFQILASEVQSNVDCTVCANCCRHSIVQINPAEIGRIAAYLGITVDDATRLYTEPDPEDSTRRILRTSKQGCVFLDRNLCIIYDARPKTCRDFPHVEVGSHSLGGRPASIARWAALCPILFNALEQYKHVTGYIHRSH